MNRMVQEFEAKEKKREQERDQRQEFIINLQSAL